MPEGDTIWRTAGRLRPALEGRTVARFRAARLVGPGPAIGTTIDGVEAAGKWLLVHFGDGTTLRTHMKMTGSWHLYRRGERWRKAPRTARVEIETDAGWVAVCFSAPNVELVRGGGRPSHLGPDLTGPDPDLSVAAARFDDIDPATPIAVALLDQRICCGVGNIYKSEVLHAERLDPRSSVGTVPSSLRRRLVGTANRLLRSNLGSGARTTVAGGLAVYGRAGEPCLRCGAPIERIVQGEQARSTYFCPECQTPAPRMPA